MHWLNRISVGVVLAHVGFLSLENNAQAQYGQQPLTNTRNGALLGGVTGAVIGGVVGHQRDDTAEGALIGGAVGAIAGGVLGNQRDHAERQRYYHSQPVYVSQPTIVEHRTYVPVQTRVVTRRPVSPSEVVSMTQSGVSDSVIVAHIQANGVASRPDVNEVIWMNQNGVSDYVITTMQQNGRPPAASNVYRTYPSEVVVREEYRPATRTIYTNPPTPTYRQAVRQPVYVERRGF